MDASRYIVHLVEAHRPAQDEADKTSLPQTVFYHPDYGFSNLVNGHPILKGKQFQLYVTWLPSNYFN